VLRFAATYAAAEGYLPSPSEIALGCGIKSPKTARRAMRELEELGFIQRDTRYPRLGVVQVGAPTHDMDVELWLAALSLIEGHGNLEAIRKALAFAPDLEAKDFLYREGNSRVTLMRAYSESERRLRMAGAELSSAAEASLAAMPGLVEARHDLFTDWTSYCLYSTMTTWASHSALSVDKEYEFAHLGPVHHGELAFYDLWARLDRQVIAPALRRRDPDLIELAIEISEHFDIVISTAVSLFHDVLRPALPRFDLPAFLVDFERDDGPDPLPPAR
jgi:hypothetical protein